ncbi:hypothetical protein F511_46372 [Dorcoceras hygrometricum]|uniref:Uncharacterized protein n=1 Tax=Dorcoceras hygrometricum TaxID=472368 RepID=A0A2Z7A0P2_9LAMI|nr:hypothetical protein F511_46372 [Dorcoceras hygrometricum]
MVDFFRLRAVNNSVLVALSSSCQDRSFYTSFESFEQLEEEREEATVCYRSHFGRLVLLLRKCFRDDFIEDERQYRAPHLHADLVVSRYETSG